MGHTREEIGGLGGHGTQDMTVPFQKHVLWARRTNRGGDCGDQTTGQIHRAGDRAHGIDTPKVQRDRAPGQERMEHTIPKNTRQIITQDMGQEPGHE